MMTPSELEEAYYCMSCSGTGEGQYDGSRCLACGGTGEDHKEYDPEDFNIPDELEVDDGPL